MTKDPTKSPRVVSPTAWRTAQKAFLTKQKEFARHHEALLAERRALPWVEMTKRYRFEAPEGAVTLEDLFAGCSQLIVQHFMFGPGWREGCVGCSFQADHIDAAWQHLRHHDVSFAAIARAPLPEIEAFKRRMGWAFTWVSSYGSDFNYDFRVSFTPEEVARGATIDYEDTLREIWAEEMPGISVFARDAAGTVFHTYSSYGRGDESLIGAYQYLDLTPNGRNENGPYRNLTDWVRLHDRYDTIGGDADGLGLAAEFAIPPRD